MSATTRAAGFKAIAVGFELQAKADKTTAEKAAALSFTITFTSTIVTLVIMLICLSLGSLLSLGNNSYFTNRTGYVENGQIKYIQNTEKYISFAELGIEEALPNGSKLTLFFDSEDNLAGYETKSQKSNRSLKSQFYGFVLPVGISLLFLLIAYGTFAKPYRNWYTEYLND